MVVPPSVAQEDYRRRPRERTELVAERTRLTNRIGSLLANQGIAGFKPLKKGAPRELDALRTGDGHELPPHLRTTIARILHRIESLAEQIKAAEAERELAAAHGAGGGGGRCGGVPHRPYDKRTVAVAAAWHRAGICHGAAGGSVCTSSSTTDARWRRSSGSRLH